MVKIRLARTGAKKKPFYHIVVTHKANARDGRYIERVGFFNPVAVGGEVPLRVNVERVKYWQGQGAQLSERVSHLVKSFSKYGEGESRERAAPSVSQIKADNPAASAEPADDAAQGEAAS